MSIVLDLPIGRVADPALPTLALALDPFRVETLLRLHVTGLLGGADLRLESLALVRHKPGRRAMVEYRVTVDGVPAALLGKLRGRGADRRAFAALHGFRAQGFAEPADVVVPEPVALREPLGMLLMRRMPGTPFLQRTDRAAAVAAALTRLQSAVPTTTRIHGGADELATLERELGHAAGSRPWLARRLGAVLEAVAPLTRRLDAGPQAALHRDFYHEQVLVDGDRLVLLDLDCHAIGHPAIDAGNFIGHLMELELRGAAAPGAHAGAIAAFRDRWLAGAAGGSAAALEDCVTLTLARHAGLAGRLPGRAHAQPAVLAMVERRLAGEVA